MSSSNIGMMQMDAYLGEWFLIAQNLGSLR